MMQLQLQVNLRAHASVQGNAFITIGRLRLWRWLTGHLSNLMFGIPY
jgi:hypothetical protein